VREIDSPAAPGSLAPSLAAGAHDRLLLSWVEPGEGGRHALRFATRPPGGAWSTPLTVAAGAGWFVNWADFPHVAALPDGTLFAHWMEKRPGGKPYDYDVRVTRSRDAGRTWEASFPPYGDATPGEHGFVSFAPHGDGRMGVAFLDGRETARAGGAMTLRFAAIGPSGAPEADVRVDDRVCDCCQTALARTARGLVVAYRDRSEGEVRDIAVRRLEAGRWSEPVYPGGEGWVIHGCPVNGPSLAAEGDEVALAWFTMEGERPRVKAAFSADGGGSWTAPVAVDDGQPAGRVDVVLLPGGALVVWLEVTAEGAEVRARRVARDGSLRASIVVASSSAARSSGFPRLARAGGEVVAAWRDASEPPRVRAAVVEAGG
jgi:hypothetical protein